MTGSGMQHLLASLAIAAPLALGVAVTPSGPEGHKVFAFQDPTITEASALVIDRGLFLTTNDSGHPGDVYAVDRAGDTVGITHWSDHPDDTEALAPAGEGHVWVGDIGDNVAERSSVDLARVPIGRGNREVKPTIYKLVYPDGPTNAETLLRNPTTGRLYIASKNIFGGVLYAVPAELDPSGPNRLKAIGRVMPVATDGSFFPDGRHLVIRAYTSAVVYDWPSMQPVARFELPAERQGEGIAVADDGRVYLSSEGPRAPVLEVSLPPKIEAAVHGETSIGPASPTGSSDLSSAGQDPGSRDAWPWVAGGLLGVAAILVLLRALRPR